MVAGPDAIARGMALRHCGTAQDAPMLVYALMSDYTFDHLMCPPLTKALADGCALPLVPPASMKMLHFDGGAGCAVTCMCVTPMFEEVMAWRQPPFPLRSIGFQCGAVPAAWIGLLLWSGCGSTPWPSRAWLLGHDADMLVYANDS